MTETHDPSMDQEPQKNPQKRVKQSPEILTNDYIRKELGERGFLEQRSALTGGYMVSVWYRGALRVELWEHPTKIPRLRHFGGVDEIAVADLGVINPNITNQR